MASSATKEPSYTTLSNLAEIFSEFVYKAPEISGTSKLEESSLPNTPQFELGVITDMYGLGSGRGPQPIYTVKLNSGAVIAAHSISGDMYGVGYVVAVLHDQGGAYTIISGGDEKYQSKDRNRISQFGSEFDYYVTDENSNPQLNYGFRAFDTASLLLVIKTLVTRINALESRFNQHTHAVSQAVAQPVTIPSQDMTGLDRYVEDYDKSHTDKFKISY